MVKKWQYLGDTSQLLPQQGFLLFHKFKYGISLLKTNCKMLTTKMHLCAQLTYSSSLKSSRPLNWSRNKAKDFPDFALSVRSTKEMML